MSEALPIGRLGTAVLPSTPDEEVKTAERVQDCDKEAQTSKLHSSDDNKDQDDEPLQLYVAQGEQRLRYYGWVVILSVFMGSMAIWGSFTSFGIYLSFFLNNNFFPGTNNLTYSSIGGIGIAVAQMNAPFAYRFIVMTSSRASLVLGTILVVASLVLSGFTRAIWQLVMTQAVLFGFGASFIFVPQTLNAAFWFEKKRAVALGLASGGSGLGGLMFSNAIRAMIERLGLKWAYVINGLACLVLLVPDILFVREPKLLRQRRKEAKASERRAQPMDYSVLRRTDFQLATAWACSSVMGYSIAMFCLASFATLALGFSQTQASTLQSLLCVGQFIGRPGSGWMMDRWGRLNMAALASFSSGVTLLALWLPARSFGLLAVFALTQGAVGGIFWSACTPVTTELVGLEQYNSAISIMWFILAAPCAVSTPIAFALVNSSRHALHLRGPSEFYLAIATGGALVLLGSGALLMAKFKKQGNWHLLQKT